MLFVRFGVVGFVVLTVIYWLVVTYSRSVRRERLEDWWEELDEEEKAETDRETYVEEGMAEYEASFRPKLIFLVYVIPAIAVATLIYIIN